MEVYIGEKEKLERMKNEQIKESDRPLDLVIFMTDGSFQRTCFSNSRD